MEAQYKMRKNRERDYSRAIDDYLNRFPIINIEREKI
jgi:hypothetical protein